MVYFELESTCFAVYGHKEREFVNIFEVFLVYVVFSLTFLFRHRSLDNFVIEFPVYCFRIVPHH